MGGRIWAIALNTFREATRRRVVYGVLLLVVAVNVAAIFLGEASGNNEARVARDFGLAAIMLGGSFTAIYLGVSLLYAEIDRRTVHAIVSKPMERWEFVVGKFTGIVLVNSLLVAAFAAAMLFDLAAQGIAIGGTEVKAMLLAWMGILVVAAVAVFFSSFSSTFLSAIFSTGIAVLGHLTPYIDDSLKGAEATAWQRGMLHAAREIVPDLHVFAASGQVVDGQHVSVNADFVTWGYVGATAGGYALLWIAGLLVLSAAIFSRRDFA